MKEHRHIISLLNIHYGIECPIEISVLQGASSNSNWFVRTSANQYVLQKSALLSMEADKYEALTKALFRCNIQVSKIIPTVKGKIGVYQYGCWWMLKFYIQGRTLKLGSYSDIGQAANALRRIHSVPYASMLKYCYTSIHDPYHWLCNPDVEIANLQKKFQQIKEIKIIIYMLDNILSAVTLTRLYSLPLSVVHGDYHGRNLIYSNDILCGVIDLDTMGISSRIIDVTIAVFLMSRYNRTGFEINIKAAELFIKTYTDHNGFTVEEIDMILYILILRMIPRACYLQQLKSLEPARVAQHIEWVIRATNSIFKNEALLRKLFIEAGK